jgi:hypothetical protein
MNFRVKFGIQCSHIDVTDIVLQHCMKENIAFIPGDNTKRVELFTDPLYRVRKQILIYDSSGNVLECHNKDAFIDTIKDIVFIGVVPDYIKEIFPDIYAKV